MRWCWFGRTEETRSGCFIRLKALNRRASATAKQKNPGRKAGIFFNSQTFELGSAALSHVVVFFVLALAALFLAGLSALLTGLAALTGLPALLATLVLALLALLTGLPSLPRLATLLSKLATLSTLFVFVHIVCHEYSPPFKCASRRII
jgi:hypothetical protein